MDMKPRLWFAGIFIGFCLFLLPLAAGSRDYPSVVEENPSVMDEKPSVMALRIGIHTFPACLNPIYAVDETSQGILNKVFDSLFFFDHSGELQNGLVSLCRLDKKAKKIILTLKKGIRFADGAELDAGDVLTTINTIKNPANRSPYRPKLAFIHRAVMLNKYTLELSLEKVQVTWKHNLVIKIAAARELEALGPGNLRTANLSGTGAYHIRRINEPEELILQRSPSPTPAGMYRTIRYRVVPDPQQARLKLLTGELDICELPPDGAAGEARDLRRRGVTRLKYKKFGFTYLVFNLKNHKLTPDIRRIFYNILVHGDFPARFLEQKGEPVKTPFLMLNPGMKTRKFPVRPLSAPLRLRLLTNGESRTRKAFVLFLAEELKTYNIHIDPQFREYHTFLKSLRESRFDMAVSGFLLDIDYDMKDIFYSDAYFNYAGFGSPEMDRLLDAGLREFDPRRREKIYREAHRVWLDRLPLLPLFNLYYYVGVSDRVKIPAVVSALVASESDFLYNIREWKANEKQGLGDRK